MPDTPATRRSQQTPAGGPVIPEPGGVFGTGDFSSQSVGSQEFSNLGTGIPQSASFREAGRSGVEGMMGDYRYARAALDLALGDEDGARRNVDLAREHDEAASALMAGSRGFLDTYNDPSFGGTMDYVKTTLGQLAPSVLESLTTMAVGSVVGTAAAPGVGTLAGGAAGLANRTLMKSAVRQSVKESLERTAKGLGDEVDDRILSGLVRAKAAKAGATVGALASEYPHGVGMATREQVDAGRDIEDVNPYLSAGVAVPYAALGALSDRIGLDTALTALRRDSSKPGSLIHEAVKAMGANALTEGLTEVGQEETMIRLRNAITDGDYAGSDDAFSRRIESLAAGALGGGARAGFSYAPRILGDQAVKAGESVRQAREEGRGIWSLGGPSRPRSTDGSRLDDLIRRFQPAEPTVDENGFVVRDDADDDGDTVMPEPQSDIDGQFEAMLDPNTDKRAMEITRGSPMPRGLEGREDVHQVDTPNGVMLTQDDELADRVSSGLTSAGSALGYANPKRAGMNRVLSVRDSQGRRTHYEVLDTDRETEMDAFARGARYGDNVSIENADDVIQDRRQKLEAEGRDPDLESTRVQFDNAQRGLAETQDRLSFLNKTLSDPRFANRADEIRAAIPRAHAQLRRREQQARGLGQQLQDMEARQQQRASIEQQQAAATERGQRMASMLRGYEESGDGIEVIDNETGEQLQLPRDQFEQMLPEYGEQADGGDLEYDPRDRARQRAIDELESQGFSVERQQINPIQIEDIDGSRLPGMRVPESRLRYDDPTAYDPYADRGKEARTGRSEAAFRSNDQVIRQKYTLGPKTARTTINGAEVPVSAIRKMRELQRKFPNDQWSLARTSEGGKQTFHVRRQRSLGERENDIRVTRGVGDGQTLRDPAAPGQVDDRAEIEAGTQQGATERILTAVNEARRPPDAAPRDTDIMLINPDGSMGRYNSRRLASVGADIDVVGNEVSTPERMYTGLQTALGELLQHGFRIPDGNQPGMTVPLNVRKLQSRRGAGRVPGAVAAMWADMDQNERSELLGLTGDAMSQTEIQDMDARDLPDEAIQALEQRQWESATPEGDNSPTTEYVKYDDGSTARAPRTRPNIRPSSQREGFYADYRVPQVSVEAAVAALKGAGHRGSVTMITEGTTREDLLRAGELTEADIAQLEGSPLYRKLVNGTYNKGQRGRMFALESGRSVVWVNPQLQPAGHFFTTAHEMGHVVYQSHFNALIDEQSTYESLYNAFLNDQAEGRTRTLKNPEHAFEEWYADKFAAWTLDQTDPKTAKAGQFAQLRTKMRGMVQMLRQATKKLIREGKLPTAARLQSNQVFNNYMNGVARTNALRQQEAELMAEIERGGAYRRLDESPQVQLRQVRAELAALTDTAPMHAAIANSNARPDALARQQEARLREHLEQQFLVDPKTAMENPDQYHIEPRHEFELTPDEIQHWEAQQRFEDTEQAPTDPAPQQRFEAEPESQADPAPQQRFESEPESQADPAPQQRFTDTSAKPEQARIRAKEVFERQAATSREKPQPGRPDMSDAAPANGRRPFGFAKYARPLENALPKSLKGGWRVVRDVVWTDDSRMRSIPDGGQELASMFWTQVGERHRGPKGWFNAVESEMAHHMNEFDAILPKDPEQARAALEEAQSSRATEELSDAGWEIREALNRFYTNYASKNIRGLKLRDNYFPRVYDFSAMASRPEEMGRLIQKHMGYSQQVADAAVREMINSGTTVEMATADQEGSGPGMSARLERTLAAIPDTELQEAGLLQEPRAALMSYLRQAVRNAEYQRRFAGDRPVSKVIASMERRQAEGQQIDTEFLQNLRQTQEENGPDFQVHDPSAVINDTIDGMAPQDRPLARKIVQNYMGRSNTLGGKQITPEIARTFSALSAVSFTATLGLATLSQVTDFGAMTMRSRDARGFKDLQRTLLSVPAAERRALATAVGSVSADLNMQALRMSYGNDFMTPGVRKYVDTFFKVIGLDAVTNFNRSVATHMGYQFILHHSEMAKEGDPRSQRYMEELGLQPHDVDTWASRDQGGNQWSFEGESGERVRQALFQWTDEAILRPNAAQRPGWASNPWFTLIWQLKSFAWGMGKVVMAGMANEMYQRHKDGESPTSALAPMAFAGAMMMPLAFASVVLKDLAKEGLNALFDDDDYKWQSTRDRGIGGWMMELADRSGMMGAWSLVNTAMSADMYGQSPLMSVMGPTAGYAEQLSRGEFGRVANDLIPVAGLVR